LIDGAEIITAALEDFGEEALVNDAHALVGLEPFRAIPQLSGRTVLIGEYVERTGPIALARQSDVDALDLQAGNAGDVLTFTAGAFRIITKNPEENGLAVLTLEAA